MSLSVASALTVSVNYASANGTATAGSDYTAASGTLTFNPNDTSKTITVSVSTDLTVEPNETFTVSLSSPSNVSCATVGSDCRRRWARSSTTTERISRWVTPR